jgi:hypothetical protein
MAGRGDAEKTIAALRARAEAAEGELARLRHAIHEASDPDFLYGTMDNVASVDTPLMDCAQAASGAIRAAAGQSTS